MPPTDPYASIAQADPYAGIAQAVTNATPSPSLWDRAISEAKAVYHHPVEAAIGAAKEVPSLIRAAMPQGSVLPSTDTEADKQKAQWSPKVQAFLDTLGEHIDRMMTPQNEAQMGGAHVADIGAVAANAPAAVKGVAELGQAAKPAVQAAIRGGVRGANVALAKAPGTVGAAIGGGIGAATGIPYATEVGAAAGAGVGREVLPMIKIPGENFGLPRGSQISISVQPYGPLTKEVTQAEALTNLPKTGALPAAQTGEALAAAKPAAEPAAATAEKVPAKVMRQSKALVNPLEQARALKQSAANVVDEAIPATGETRVLNVQTKQAINQAIAKGDIEGAQTALSDAVQKTPEFQKFTPQDIRDPVAKAKARADFMEDQAIRQDMARNLERHGAAAEMEASKEFAARNSMDTPKGVLQDQANVGNYANRPIKPVKYTKTPGVNLIKNAETGEPMAAGDLEQLLRQSLAKIKPAK